MFAAPAGLLTTALFVTWLRPKKQDLSDPST